MRAGLDRDSEKLLLELRKHPIQEETLNHDYGEKRVKELKENGYIKEGHVDDYSFRTGFLLDLNGKAYLLGLRRDQMKFWVPVSISTAALIISIVALLRP